MQLIAGAESFESLRASLACHDARGGIRELVANWSADEWKKVAALALYHEVAPLWYAQLQSAGWPGGSEQVRAVLMPSVNTRAAHSLFLVGQLTSVCSELTDAGVPHLVVKGPALAATIYPGPAVRPFLDLDLLISPDDFGTTAETFDRLGYRKLALNPLRRKLYVTIHGQFSFARAVPMGSSHGNLTIDVHTNAFPPGYPYKYSFDRLIDRSQVFHLLGHQFIGLAPADCVSQLAFHGVKNRWNRLKFVVDMARSIDTFTTLDWGELFETAQQEGWLRVLLLACLLAFDLLEAPVPGYFIEAAYRDNRVLRARDRALSLLSEPAGVLDGGFLERVRFNMDVQDGLAGRLRYATFAAARRLSDFALRPAAA